MFFNRGFAKPQGSAGGCQMFRRNRPKLHGTKFSTTVLCGCSNITVSLPLWIALKTLFINCFDFVLPLCYGSLRQRVPEQHKICGRFRCSKKVETHCSRFSIVECDCTTIVFHWIRSWALLGTASQRRDTLAERSNIAVSRKSFCGYDSPRGIFSVVCFSFLLTLMTSGAHPA